MKYIKIRVALVVLEAILAITAISGAIWVIPNLPLDWIKGTIFPNYTIPALSLGILVGGSAIVAALTVIVRPVIGAAASVLAGAMIIGFELVEILAVGFTMVTLGADQPQSWLQVAYLSLGTTIAILGARLWRALGGRIPLAGGDYARREQTLSGS